MGTRNLTVVVLDNDVKVAQYGQWDGYLSGQGLTVAKFIDEDMDLEVFKNAVRNTTFIGEDEINARYKKAGKNFKEQYPELSRDTAADVLELLQTKGGLELMNNISFAADSLFCEYAYVLDLDSNNLEIYKGFNKTPLSQDERFL